MKESERAKEASEREREREKEARERFSSLVLMKLQLEIKCQSLRLEGVPAVGAGYAKHPEVCGIIN